MTDVNPQDLADGYIALWTQPDAELRRKAIRDLWAEDGTHILWPPVEIREAAAALGFDSTTLEARGHGALEARVTEAMSGSSPLGSTHFGRAATPPASATSSSSPCRRCPPVAARRSAAVW